MFRQPAGRISAEKGFALLEILLTVVLLAAVLVPLMDALSTGIFAFGDHESSLVATRLAQEKMEELKNKSYANVASESKAAVSGFSAFDREVTVTTPQTDLKQANVTVYWDNRDDELSVSLVTYVSNI